MDPYQFWPWYPSGVREVIAAGASHYVGIVDENTILKFPLVPPTETDRDTDTYTAEGQEFRNRLRQEAIKGLEVEARILKRLGRHSRIVHLKRKCEDGLRLERMRNGSVERYLRRVRPDTPLDQRLRWTWQAAEGLAYIHAKNILHCDVSAGNLLLDRDLNAKLSDFQGRLLGPDGTVLLDGGAAESAMSSMPRPDRNHCDCKTDLFALGTTIYFIVTGQPPFPGLDPVDDEDEIRRRFECDEFPSLEQHRGGEVVRRCWMRGYESATEVMLDLQNLER